MKLPQFIPPKDLLERVQGVETGLKRGKSVEKVGWGAFIVSAGPVLVWLVKTYQETGLKASNAFLWPLIVAAAAIVLIVMLINWTRIWVRASRKSFRYTYSIDQFEPIAGSEDLPRSPADVTGWTGETDVDAASTNGAPDESTQPPDESTDEASATTDSATGETEDATAVDEAETRSEYDSEDEEASEGYSGTGTGATPLAWFVQDLTDRLSRRIGRLSWLPENLSGEPTAQSHIHIDGTYGVRKNAQGVWNVEVLPRVRIGSRKAPATVAHLVKFTVGPDQSLPPEAYEKLLERLYFSVASHLYGQIRGDVSRKINMLPKRYFRASAYFHEAGDYARSNTLDAYEQARELYAEVIRLYDPSWWHFSGSRVRRSFQRLSAWWLRFTLKVRRRAARFWPSFARAQLMVARAEIGYASMVLNRRTLAGMSGQRLNSVFEARPVAESALQRLGELADDTPGYGDAWFEANVTLAASHAQLASTERAAKYLDDAKELDPGRAQTDSRFLHVHGQIVESRRSVVDLHRAVELDSTSDVAQYDLASALEMMWRARTTLERDVAEVVRDEYERVLTVNPGNISAWGNLGYIDWLLGEKEDLEQAARVFERGREYKEIKRETFVSELDYGLARIAAERGEFNEAYRRYIDAVGARFGQGVAHDPGYTDYQFARVTRAVVRRFETYRDNVRKKWEELEASKAKDPSQRVRNAVYAFVLNDYAEACLNYFLRSANRRYLEKAQKALEYAERELKASYPMIYFNLHRILSLDKHADSERAGDFIERVVELQPDWVDGKLERSLWYIDVASKGRMRADQLERDAEGLGGDAKRHRAQAVERQEKGQSALFEKREQGAGHLLSLLRSGAIEGSAGHAGSSAERGVGWQGGDHPETRAAPEPRGAPELELPLPLTTPLEDQGAARQLDKKAETIHQRADELLERAQTERAVATERERHALAVVRELLPHGWLWKEVRDPETGEPRDELDLSAFDNPEYLRTRRWERELDDVHVRALVMWCRLARSADASDRARVLEFVREHFLPSDYDLLTERSELVKGDDGAELREVVKDWVEGEHAWWSLRRVTDGKLFEPADAAKVLIRVARTDRTLPDGLFLWVAGQLDRLAGTLDEKAKKAESPEDGVVLQELAEDCRSEAVNCHNRIRQSALADASVLFKLGDVLLARGDDRAALDAYRAAEKIDEDEGYETHPATMYRRAMAVPHWKLGQYKEALAELTQIDEAEVARVDKKDGVEPWRDQLVTHLVDCDAVKTSKAYRLLKDWLGRVLTAHRSNEHVRQDASTALLRLGLLRYHQLERRTLEPEAAVSITDAMSPTVPPVVLEADAGSFFPEDAETPRVQQMLAADGDIERMRKRVEARMGIEVPGMQLLSRPGLGPGRYNVILDGALAAVGTLGSESLFATDLEAARSHALDGRADVDPLDETQPGGLWLAPDVDPPAELEIIDRYEYMLRHAEAVLLRNLDLFYGIEQVAAVFAKKPKMVSTPESLVRMAAVSRALLREGVPLRDPRAIAAEVVKPDADAIELPALVERVRETLAKALPGADGSRPLVSVRHDIEDEIARWTQRRDGKEFIAVPGAKLAELRRLVDEQVASLEPGAALVVRPRGLRRFVRRVVELDHPAVTVLAFTELPPDVQLKVEEPLLAPTPSVEVVA